MDIVYRRAKMADLAAVIEFTDYWLAGRGKADGVPGVVNDYFISHKQHFDYIQRYSVLLALIDGGLIGWAVSNQHHVLIHVLIGGGYRSRGIGGEMIRRLNPEVIRSKMDQSTGDPAAFYERCGYERAAGKPIGKKKNIQLFIKADGGGADKT